MTSEKRIILRSEQNSQGSRHLWAYLDAEGDLHIDGQDLGSGTDVVSPDGEYEWFQTIKAADIPLLLGLLGAARDADILTVLATNWSRERSYDLEKVLRDSGHGLVELFVY